jgi:acyl carrier protein
MTIGISTKGNQTKETMVSSLLKLVDSKELHPNPFNSGDYLYPSGGLSRYLPNGSLLLCGRKDHQVKIRGFRIELAEIEQILLNEPTIAQAVVCAWQPGENNFDESNDASNRQLIAYVQRNMQAEQQKEQQQSSDNWLQTIIEHLPEVLPATMLPTHVFVLDNIPRLANGKIDRNNLPSPETLLVNSEFIAPSSALETLLAKEMAQLLNLEKISAQRSFFSLGGHSLLIIKLVSRLRKQLQVDIHPGVVFDNPSVVELANALSNEESVIPEKLERTAQIRLKLNSMTPEQREALLARSKGN